MSEADRDAVLHSMKGACTSHHITSHHITSFRFSDALADMLDQRHGGTALDPSVFTNLTRAMEHEFHADMQALNVNTCDSVVAATHPAQVLPPDALTRVTEYVPAIVTFVQHIIDNGFAYVRRNASWRV